MKIVYVSNLCSDAVFRRIMDTAAVCPSMCEQKYHRIMTQGMAMASGSTVTAVTALPISRTTHRQWLWRAKKDADANVRYHYLPVVNVPVIKLLWQTAASFFTCSALLADREPAVVICDMLCGSAAMGAQAAARLFGRHFTGIITDLPEFLGRAEKVSFLDRMLMRQMQSCDSYVLLTEAMDQKVNPHRHPCCVVEGQADSFAHTMPEEEKAVPMLSMYAGAVEKIYGLDRLVHAFSGLPEDYGVLEIYGNGRYVEELKAFCLKNPRVRYMGVQPNSRIVQRERQAMLLINPRPSDAEFTKYSFPSKTMEYLASGTAVLTTRLPGIPEEYDRHLYYIDDESTEGIRAALERVLSQSTQALLQTGLEGQRWVLEEKNSRKQAQKILRMWDNIRK